MKAYRGSRCIAPLTLNLVLLYVVIRQLLTSTRLGSQGNVVRFVVDNWRTETYFSSFPPSNPVLSSHSLFLCNSYSYIYHPRDGASEPADPLINKSPYILQFSWKPTRAFQIAPVTKKRVLTTGVDKRQGNETWYYFVGVYTKSSDSRNRVSVSKQHLYPSNHLVLVTKYHSGDQIRKIRKRHVARIGRGTYTVLVGETWGKETI